MKMFVTHIPPEILWFALKRQYPLIFSGHGGLPPRDERLRKTKGYFANSHLPFISIKVISSDERNDTAYENETYAKGTTQEFQIVFTRKGVVGLQLRQHINYHIVGIFTICWNLGGTAMLYPLSYFVLWHLFISICILWPCTIGHGLL